MKKMIYAFTMVILCSLTAKADFFDTMTSAFKIDENTSYKSTLEMRNQRKFGIGTAVGGNLGVFGMTVELNFEDENGAIAGFGTGPGYNSFEILWKHSFDGDYIAPYTTLGYSRWYNSAGKPDDINRSSILSRAVSESDKASGQFATNFLTGSIGLQYNQLSTELAGLSVFGEIIILDEVERSVVIPTGAVGAVYYF